MNMRRLALSIFSHRTLALLKWDLHFLVQRMRNALGRQRRRIAAAMANRSAPLYLNLGSGPRGLDSENWINIDGFLDRNVHFSVDFSRRLPFPDESFDGVFCEHVIEHFTFEDASIVCREILRILKPGGVVRLIVPDAERIITTYVEAPDSLPRIRGLEGMTAMQVVNDYFRQRYEHQFLYDWPTMQQMLSHCGFDFPIRCSYGTGSLPDMLIDDEKYAWESLYVEASKGPAAV